MYILHLTARYIFFTLSGFGYQANALSSLDLRHQSSIRSLGHHPPSHHRSSLNFNHQSMSSINTTTNNINTSHLSSHPPPNSDYRESTNQHHSHHESNLSINDTTMTTVTSENITQTEDQKQQQHADNSQSGIPPLGVMMPPLGADISTIQE